MLSVNAILTHGIGPARKRSYRSLASSDEYGLEYRHLCRCLSLKGRRKALVVKRKLFSATLSLQPPDRLAYESIFRGNCPPFPQWIPGRL